MTGSLSGPDHEGVAAAYTLAAGRITLARKLIADGADVDLAPIRPAILDLCRTLRALPKPDAAPWLARLVELQRALAALAKELADRHGRGGRPPQQF